MIMLSSVSNTLSHLKLIPLNFFPQNQSRKMQRKACRRSGAGAESYLRITLRGRAPVYVVRLMS